MTNSELEWSFCSKGSTCFAGELSVQNSSANPTLGTEPRPFPLQCCDHQVIPCLVWLPLKPFQVSADQSCLFGGSNHPHEHSLPAPGSLFPNLVLSGESWRCTGGWEIPFPAWRSPSHLHLSKTVAEELLPAPNHVLDWWSLAAFGFIWCTGTSVYHTLHVCRASFFLIPWPD